MVLCKLCNKECKSWGSLSKHLLYNHQEYTTHRYYDEFILTSLPKCEVCNSSSVTFISISRGYYKTCSHSCACTLHRRNLALDNNRQSAFVDKVSSNQEKIWKDRKNTGEFEQITDRIRSTLLNTYNNMTDDERKEKYGWINRLSEEEKIKWIREVMLDTGAHKWWREAPEKDRSKVCIKRNAAIMGVTTDTYVELSSRRSEKQNYIQICRNLSEQTYRQYKNEIDPQNRRGRHYHLDHKFSILRGYANNIPPEIISSKFNLEIVSKKDNLEKHTKCSITIEYLLEMYYV